VTTGDDVGIRAEMLLADPDGCKFTVERSVHPGGPFAFESVAEAAGSPLVERLFALDGVVHVIVAGSVVNVTKRVDASWAALKPAVAGAIRAHLRSGIPAILEDVQGAGQPRSAAAVRAAVERLVEREVNPSLARHGGRISVAGLQGSTLYVAMSGGCQGCAASSLTLRAGFELMVKRVAPEIAAVVDTTDHEAGTVPYYARFS
jgi:Fe-S cluster biogenesis protein NfuA